MRRIAKGVTAIVAIAAFGEVALAQATRPAPGAGLARIDDGVFELRQGNSVDLTKHAILLTVRPDQSDRLIERGLFYVMIAGQQQQLSAGKRVDLKRMRALERELKSTAQCFLDVVSFVAPKGAPATATFRLSCV